MLHDEVASHYRERGYDVRERVKIRGSSGAVHAVDLVAQGPLGNLVVAVEDAGGFEGPEMHAIKRAAKDIGATPVMAARRIPEGLRRQAAVAGVVLLDDTAMHARPEPEPAPSEPEYPPWPGQGDDDRAWPDPDKPRRREPEAKPATKSTDPGIWSYPRQAEDDEPEEDVPAPRPSGFDWLPKERVASAPLRQDPARPSTPASVPAPRVPEPVTTRPTPAATPGRTRAPEWYWLLRAAVFGAAAGGAYFALSFILG